MELTNFGWDENRHWFCRCRTCQALTTFYGYEDGMQGYMDLRRMMAARGFVERKEDNRFDCPRCSGKEPRQGRLL